MVAIGIIAGCGIVISYLLVRLYRQKKEIYDFTEELQRCLTLMKAGEDIGNEAEFKDSLWDKIYQDLQELMDVWNRKNRQSHKEKEQIKELISDISHQGRTPMANIKIYLEILEEEQEDKVRRQECIGKLIKQTERMDFLMQSLVKLSRLETGIIEICEKDTKIFEVLGLAVAAVVPGAEAKEISVHVDCPETLKLFCDAKWTQEAIFNLLENAVKYTPKGGSIYISVMEQEVFGKISIRDTGRGIPAEHQAQIFQRFYREPEVHDEDGIGIGLYLARKIVTMQDGYMEVHSESGKGGRILHLSANEIKEVVRTEELKKYYPLGTHTVKALDGVNLTVKEGEFVAITGKSGSGKSTLLHMLGALDVPTSGEVYIDGKSLASMTREEQAVFRRRKVGVVFQSYNLIPDLSVYENIVLPIELDGGYVDKAYIEELLRQLKIEDKRDALPGTLSGGQQQRTAIARALSYKPAILLADEPTGNLDTQTSHDVMGLLKTVARKYQQTTILITHAMDVAQLSDRIVYMEDGKIRKERKLYA